MQRIALVLASLALLALGQHPSRAAARETKPGDGSRPIRRSTAEIMAEAAAAGERLRAIEDREVKRRPIDWSHRRPNADSPEVSRLGATEERLAPTEGPAPAPRAPQVVSTPNFTSVTLDDAVAIPPDTMGAIGPTDWVTHVNGRIRSHAKATGAVGALDVGDFTFWSPVVEDPVGGFVSDPRVRFDRLSDRWFLIILDIPGNIGANGSRILLAVSDRPSITPATVWQLFYFDQDVAAPAGDAGCLADYPTLAVDASALYIGANMFCGPDIGNLFFSNTSAWVVRKSDVLAPATPADLTQTPGAVAAFRTLLNPTTFEGPYTPHGADNTDAAATKGYLIGVDGATFGTLVLREVLAPGSGSPSLGPDRRITVPSTTFPINVTTPGGGPPLDGIDDRLMAAHARSGRIWTSHQIQVNSGGVASNTGGRNGVRWYEIGGIDTASPSPVQVGTVFDSATTNPLSFWMGTIMVSGQGHAALGMTAAGALVRPGAATLGRLSTDAPGTTQGAPVVYHPGQADYVDTFSGAVARWGDYSMTSLDPCDDMTMWTTQEFSAVPAAFPINWGARVVRLLAPPPATPTSAIPPTVPAGQSSVSVTVDASTAGGAGFYDTPSSGMSSCRQRLSAAVGAGVIVNSVAFVDPDTVMLDLDTTSATPGAASVTITNPDGQSASGSVLTIQTAQVAVTGTKTVAGSFTAGGAITYTVILTNGGSLDQGDDPNSDELTDVLPASLTLTSATATSGTAVANIGTNTVTWNGAIVAGGSVTVTIQATINAGTPVGTQVSNQGTIRYDQDGDGTNDTTVLTDDPNAGGASDPTVFTVMAPGADLAIAKTGPAGVRPGDNLVYTIVVTNNGPLDAASVQVADPTPAGLTFVSNAGDCTSAFPCDLGTVLNGQSRTITATFLVPASYVGPDPIDNTATVTSPTADPDATNNSATALTAITRVAGYFTLNPCRAMDTRNPAGTFGGPPLAANVPRLVPVVGRCGIPATAEAISVNITVTQPTAAGNVRLYPGGASVPNVSALNFSAGQTRGNNAIVPLNAAGELAALLRPSGSTHFIMDVNGYFASTNDVATPAGPNVHVVPAPEIELFFDDVVTPGTTSALVVEFADNRPVPVDQGLHSFFPPASPLRALLPNVTVPSYVQGLGRGSPAGPPTFLLVLIDTTAVFRRTVELRAEETRVLGYPPPCPNGLDRTFEPKTFYAPDPRTGEPPIVEETVFGGPVFADVSSGCGSNIGRGWGFSLYLTGRDTRSPSAIAGFKLARMQDALGVLGRFINPATLANLDTQVQQAITSLPTNPLSSIDDLLTFIAIVDANPTHFDNSVRNVSGELVGRAQSAIFIIDELANPFGVYHDPAEFQAVIAGFPSTTTTFDGFPPDQVLPSGTSINGVTYNFSIPAGGMATDDFLPVSFPNTLGVNRIPPQNFFMPGESVTLTFPTPVRAVGAYFSTNFMVGTLAGFLSITTPVGTAYSGDALPPGTFGFPANSLRFVGLVSPTPFTQATIKVENIIGAFGAVIDNVTFVP